MRTHSAIINDAGKVADIRRALLERGLTVSDSTVRSWARRPDDHGSIPPAYWPAMADAGFSTLEELAAHAERRLKTAEDA